MGAVALPQAAVGLLLDRGVGLKVIHQPPFAVGDKAFDQPKADQGREPPLHVAVAVARAVLQGAAADDVVAVERAVGSDLAIENVLRGCHGIAGLFGALGPNKSILGHNKQLSCLTLMRD